MKKKKERDFKLNIYLVIICGVIFTLFGVSIFFNTFFTYALKLKPDISAVNNAPLQVHFVDTGEGDAILIKLPNNKTLIVDSGTVNYRDKITSYIDNVFFNGKGGVFDYAILTHSDVDHAGNFKHILDTYEVRNFYRPKIYSETFDTGYTEQSLVINNSSYDQIIQKLNELSVNNKTNVMFTELNAETEVIKNYVSFLGPVNDYYTEENMYSSVIKISHLNKSILLTGDATTQNEVEIINSTSNLDIDVLKLGHHGSNTSTSLNFLNYCKPEYAIISYGENNYGHPSVEVLNNIKNYSQNLYNNIYDTHTLGNIIVAVNSDGNIEIDTIKNVDDYIYLDYYFIAIAGMGLCLIIVFFPKFKKDVESD